MNALISILTVVLSLSAPVRTQHSPANPQLSDTGRAAYERLASADVFAIGPVGIAGTTSDQELALRTLLAERQATAALASLAQSATPAGRLYGLAGLSVKDRARVHALARGLDGGTEVNELSGCIMGKVRAADILGRIERGEYVEALKRPVRTLGGKR